MELRVVVAGQHQAALAPAAQHASARIEGREQHVTQFCGGRHEPAQVFDSHSQERAVGQGNAGEEGRLPHQHAELADEVAGFDDDYDPVVSSVHEQTPPARTRYRS